ncbi:MAG: hypothetical protein HIU91_07215 [Acidobacteria bacterium]|nr:hypothetical protein [Acidobacteriota bacterium]
MSDAFKAEVHYLQVNGILHRGNEQDPLIPGIANAIVDVVSRNYFRPNPANTGVTSAVIDPAFRTIVERNTANGVNPQLTRECIVFTCRSYSFAGLQKGDTGKRQSVVVIEKRMFPPRMAGIASAGSP